MSVATSHKNMVGGEWEDAVEGGVQEVINPATGETIAEVPKGTQADVDRAWRTRWRRTRRSSSPPSPETSASRSPDMSMYSVEEYTVVKHVMAKID